MMQDTKMPPIRPVRLERRTFGYIECPKALYLVHIGEVLRQPAVCQQRNPIERDYCGI